MNYSKHSLAFLVLAIFTLPLLAQPSNKFRVDTAHTVIHDRHGNIVGQGFEFRMEGTTYEDRKDHLKTQRIAYFSNGIGLTSKEAERFWPVYNEYSDKRDNLKKEQRKILNQLSNFETMNEKDVKALLDAYVNSCVQESTLFQEYYKKFCAILPPSKVVRLYQTEEQFKQDLLRYLRSW
jgi:Spy/CpxP family protein refolding chaperone